MSRRAPMRRCRETGFGSITRFIEAPSDEESVEEKNYIPKNESSESEQEDVSEEEGKSKSSPTKRKRGRPRQDEEPMTPTNKRLRLDLGDFRTPTRTGKGRAKPGTPRTPTTPGGMSPFAARGRRWKLTATPQPQRIKDYDPLNTAQLKGLNDFERARACLHVSVVPQTMPCRDDEFYEIFGHVCEAVEEGCGSCIYISGVPGTGKTATVHAVIRHCQEAAKKEELINFHFVEINGMKLTDPQQAYSVLWESLTGQRIASQQAGGLLEKRFKEGASDGRPVVVLMDELDLLVTRNQTVMYNFFNWPTLPNSRLVVIAVANTMDLPERLLTNKVSSRLGLTRINFAPYTHDQLREIVTARLAGVQCFSKDAIEFCARKVGAVSGDARRALDICRRGVEILEIMLEEGPAVDALTIDKGRNKQVTMKVIDRAIKEMYTSPAVQAIMRAPLHHRIYLVALVRCIRRAGVPDVEHADVCDEYFRLCQFGSVTGLSWSDVGLIGWTLGDMKVLFREGGKVMERCARVRLHVGEEDVVAGVRGLEAESWLKRMVEE